MSLVKMTEIITELKCPNGHPSRAFTHHIIAALGKCYCRDCGAELVPVFESTDLPEYQDSYKCSECGCTVSSSWDFCVYCGGSLGNELDMATRETLAKEAQASAEAMGKKNLSLLISEGRYL